MPLYFDCPSCGTNLAKKQIPYEKDFNDICNNPKLTKDQKDTQKSKLLDKYDITNICCRMRFLTYIDESDVLVDMIQ